MGNIASLINVMHSFSPKGQEIILNLLKENKSLLNKEFGFAELPALLSSKGQTKLIEEQLVNPENSIVKIITSILKKEQNKLPAEDFEALQMGRVLSMGFLSRKPNPSLINYLSLDFNNKKCELIEIVKKLGNKKLEKQLKLANTPQDLSELISEINKCSMENAISKYDSYKLPDKIFELNNLEELQIWESCRSYDADIQLAVQKIILRNPNKSKEIVDLEELIKSEYKVNFVNIDNIEEGKKILEALKIAKSQNLPIPKNIIVSPSSMCETDAGLHLLQSNGEHTIILNSGIRKDEFMKEFAQQSFLNKQQSTVMMADYYIKQLNQASTQHPLHTIIHEIIHSEQLPFRRFKLPHKFDTTVETLSNYAKESAKSKHFEETRVELKTKEILESLNDEEKALLDYLS